MIQKKKKKTGAAFALCGVATIPLSILFPTSGLTRCRRKCEYAIAERMIKKCVFFSFYFYLITNITINIHKWKVSAKGVSSFGRAAPDPQNAGLGRYANERNDISIDNELITTSRIIKQ